MFQSTVVDILQIHPDRRMKFPIGYRFRTGTGKLQQGRGRIPVGERNLLRYDVESSERDHP